MSSEIAKEIVNSIEAGKLDTAKDQVFDGIKQKAAETIDMKRVEMQVDWMNKTQEEPTGETE
tara:strand:+ start:4036 stop:4221 length:186 start_codon:yes stop_codon:yes gene_type:complete